MLKMIYTVPEYLRNKKIYVWNVKRNSMIVFAMLAFSGVDIAGFVVRDHKYIGECLFNRPVCDIEEIEKTSDAILVAANACVRTEISRRLEVFYYDELLRMNSDLKKERIIIYGTGGGATKIYKELKENGISVEAFCVTDKRIDTHMNRPVLSVDELPVDDEHAVVISAEIDTYKREMQYNLEKKGIKKIYIKEYMTKDDLLYSAFVQSIYKAILEKRKIYIYTEAVDENAKMIVETLKLYQVDVEGYLYQEQSMDERIMDVWELAYANIDTVFVIISETDKCRLQDACELLEEIGFSLGHFDYAGVRAPAFEYKNKRGAIADSLLGHSEYGEKTGFHVYGKENLNDIKIVVLGNSTSNDGTFRGTCWPKLLYQKLIDSGINASVYNGAHCGNGVVEELLRLLRDVYVLKPDYVISMSGGSNSVNFPIENRFYMEHMRTKEEQDFRTEYFRGLQIEESNFEFWLRMERVMKATVETYGAKFLCYLQPMKFGKPDMSLFEECNHHDEKRDGYTFRKKASQNDFYKNLMELFDNKDDMFIDACHYSEEGKAVLADIVYGDIVAELKNISKQI